MMRLLPAVAVLLLLPAFKSAAGPVLYEASLYPYTVGSYSATTGATINGNLVTGSNVRSPQEVAVDSANHLYVSFEVGATNVIGEYNAATGAAINANLISGAGGTIALDGAGHLYAYTYNAIGEFNAITGAAINADLIKGSGSIALDGAGHLYLVSTGGGLSTIREYNATTGAVINNDLISVNYGVGGIAISGGIMYLNEYEHGIAEFNAVTGALINPNFITSGIATGFAEGLAVYDGNLFVASLGIGEFNATTGAPINTHFVPGLDADVVESIAINTSAVPEPSGLVFGTVSAMAGMGVCLRKKWIVASTTLR